MFQSIDLYLYSHIFKENIIYAVKQKLSSEPLMSFV